MKTGWIRPDEYKGEAGDWVVGWFPDEFHVYAKYRTLKSDPRDGLPGFCFLGAHMCPTRVFPLPEPPSVPFCLKCRTEIMGGDGCECEVKGESWEVRLGDDTYEIVVDPETRRVSDPEGAGVLTGLDLTTLEGAVYKLGGTIVEVLKR